MGEASNRKKANRELKEDPIHQKHVNYTAIAAEMQQMGQRQQQLAQLLQRIQMDYNRLQGFYSVLQNVMTDFIVNNNVRIKEFKPEELPEGSQLKQIDLQSYMDEINKKTEEAKKKQEEAQKAKESNESKSNESTNPEVIFESTESKKPEEVIVP